MAITMPGRRPRRPGNAYGALVQAIRLPMGISRGKLGIKASDELGKREEPLRAKTTAEGWKLQRALGIRRDDNEIVLNSQAPERWAPLVPKAIKRLGGGKAEQALGAMLYASWGELRAKAKGEQQPSRQTEEVRQAWLFEPPAEVGREVH